MRKILQLFTISLALTLPIKAFSVEITSIGITTTVTTSWTEVFNAADYSFRYQNLQILNPDGIAVTCAKTTTGTPVTQIYLPATITSVTYDRYQPKEILYCKMATGSHDLTINVWGLNQ